MKQIQTGNAVKGMIAFFLFIAFTNFTNAQTCGPNQNKLTLYTGYGQESTDNGFVNNPENAIGIPNGTYAQIKKNGTPSNRGVITIKLQTIVSNGEIITYQASAQDANVTTWGVSVSIDGIAFSSITNFSTSGSNMQLFNYTVNHFGGAQYIRFQAVDNVKEMRLDAVWYDYKECREYCISSPITYISGNAVAFLGNSEADSPDGAVGAIDGNGAKLNDITDSLLLDLGSIIPAGTYVQIFVADNGNDANFQITSSATNGSYTNPVNITGKNKAPNFTNASYLVNQSSGIRYIKIKNTNGVDAYVDAVHFRYPIHWGKSYITGNIFLDANSNGIRDEVESGTSGITVKLYKDNNNNNLQEPGEVLKQTTSTGADGSYTFEITTIDTNYTISILPGSMPAGMQLTTDNIEDATISVFNQMECGNDFGYNTCGSNCPPEAFDDLVETTQGTATYIDVLANDYDPNNNINTTSISITAQPNNGTVIINNGQIIYTPNGTFAGLDTLIYRICDLTSPTPLCDNAFVEIYVQASIVDPCADATTSHTYYIPAPESEMRMAMDRIDGCTGVPLSDSIRSIISMKISYPGTVLIYDHWEDGYEANIGFPAQSTTQIWGDKNLFNGIAPGTLNDSIPAGGSIILDNTMRINPSRDPLQIYYDGKDKIATSADIALSRIAYDLEHQGLQAYSVDVYDVNRFGTSFTVPLGENLNATNDFQYTALFVRAAYNNTTISIDKDADGVIDITTTLQQGGTYFQNGGVFAGASVSSTKPIGIDMVFGDSIACYNFKSLNILPSSRYSDEYYTPVPTSVVPGGHDSSVVMLYNPLNRSFDINWYTTTTSGTITINAKSAYRFYLQPGSGYRFKSVTGESFVANELIDAWSYNGTTNHGSTFDWAFALIPSNRLTNFASIAWAPGSTDGTANGNPVWVVATANTTLYVKWNGDLSHGGIGTAPCGSRYDVSYPVTALESKKLFDISDNDQSGLAVFTCDGTKLAVVYGEDPATAGEAFPFLDVGTSVQPMCLKRLLFANDDYVYTLTSQPVTIQVLTNDVGFLSDIDPSTVSTSGLLQPQHGTTSVNPDGTILYTPDPGWMGIDTFEYRVCSLTPPVVCDVAQVIVNVSSCPIAPGSNTNLISGRVYYDVNKNGINDDGAGGFGGSKVWLYLDANCNGIIDGIDGKLDSVIVDNSGSYQFIRQPLKTISDNFDNPAGGSTCASGNDGNVNFTGNWSDNADPSAGFCVTPASSIGNTDAEIIPQPGNPSNYVLRLKDNNVSVSRTADLTGLTGNVFLSFSYRKTTATLQSGEDILVQVSNGAGWVNLFTIVGNGVADPSFVNVQNLNIAAYAGPATTIRFLTNNSVDDADSIYIDNISIHYLKYPQCYVSKLDVSTIPSFYTLSSVDHWNITAVAAGCYGGNDYGVAYQKVIIKGTLHNDVNALLDAQVNGTVLDKPSNTIMYAYLINGGNVVAKDTLNNMNGSFDFNAADASTSYSIRLSSVNTVVGSAAPSSTLPSGWIATGEAYGVNNAAGSGVEAGTPNLQIPVNTGDQYITNIRFGIQQLPESAVNLQPDEGNPGGYNTLPVTANAFQISNVGIHPSTQDYSGGTVDSIRLVSFPTGINLISINSIIYTSGGICPPVTSCTAWPAAGISIPATGGIPSWPILIDPLEGNVDVVISFVAIDNAHFEDQSPGSVTIPLKTISVTGTVWNDSNGDVVQNGVESVINGTNVGAGIKTGSALYANLVGSNGFVIASVPVQSNGVYTFPIAPAYNEFLTVQLSNIQGNTGALKPSNTLSSGWVITGENKNGQGGSVDVTADGEISLTTVMTNITQQDFGMERLPDTDPKNQNYTLNVPGQLYLVPTLTGSDPEDGVSGAGGTFRISTLPVGAVLFYNNIAVTAGQVISNYNPALLQVDPDNHTMAVSFMYATLDAASRLDPTPAIVTLTWTTVLYLEMTSFTGMRSVNDNLLQWATDFELNTHHFVLEYSRDGVNFTPLHTLNAKGNSLVRNNYQYLHRDPQGNVGYYRLKLFKLDGSIVTSSIVIIRSQARENIISAAPNPFVNALTVNVYFERAGKVTGTLINAAGNIIRRVNWNAVSGLNMLKLPDLAGLASGSYILEIRTEQLVERVKVIKAE